MSPEPTPWIVRAMSDPLFYDHPVAGVTLIETHISWVFLAGGFAYKVKKPLNLGFLDFSSLARRHHYCKEELRLNRRFSPDIYLALTQIGGDEKNPVINREPALEYAVKMRRFPQECQLDRVLAAGQLQARHIRAFAAKIADLHQQASVAGAGHEYGSAEAVINPVLENFTQMRPLVSETGGEVALTRLEQWSRKACEQLHPVIQQRKSDGFIRECHGDVHLANMAWFEEQPLLFDCIEFDENLRWIDVINDIAFLVMDLDDRRQPALAWTFLNQYLQATGDYQGVALLGFYKVYRAIVRAKITCIRLSQGHFETDREQRRAEELFQSYLGLAEQYTQARTAPLVITHGLSGSGKSTFSEQLASSCGAIHLRSDIERKRLHDMPATAESDSPVGGGLYSTQAFAETYTRLRDLAEVVLRAGVPVIVDATFIKKKQRDMFSQLASTLNVPFVLLDFPLPEAELRRRIAQRAQDDVADASEANLEVLDYQFEHAEPLTGQEQQYVVRVEPETSVAAVVQRILEAD